MIKKNATPPKDGSSGEAMVPADPRGVLTAMVATLSVPPYWTRRAAVEWMGGHQLIEVVMREGWTLIPGRPRRTPGLTGTMTAALREGRDGTELLLALPMLSSAHPFAIARFSMGETAPRPPPERVRTDLEASVGEWERAMRRAWGTTPSPRQRQCLRLLAEGFRYKEIAARLNLSVSAVDQHVAALKARLNAVTRNEAVAKALVAGWLTTGDPEVAGPSRDG